MTLQFCERVVATVGDAFTCKQVSSAIRLRTPFQFPDGSLIDIYAGERADGGVWMTDFGEAAAWLRSNSLGLRRSPRQDALVRSVVASLRVSFVRGQICGTAAEAGLFDLVLRISQAMIRVADISYTLRRRASRAIADDVEELLVEREISYERRVPRVGDSGRQLTVDFETEVAGVGSSVFVLSSGNRSAARRVTEHVFSTVYDLARHKTGANRKFIALFDDHGDVWEEAAYNLLEEHTSICLWSNPDGFVDELSRAA